MKICEDVEGLSAALSIFLASLHEVRAEISDEALALRVVTAVDDIAGSAARIRLEQQVLVRHLATLQDLCESGAGADGGLQDMANGNALYRRVLSVCFGLTAGEAEQLLPVLQEAVKADGLRTLSGVAGAGQLAAARLTQRGTGDRELNDRLSRSEDQLREMNHENHELRRLVDQLRGEVAAGSSLISRLNLHISNLRGEIGQRSPKSRRPVGEPCIPAYLSAR